MKIGDRVLWKCRPGVLIPAVVAEVTLDRVKIRIGGVVRWVSPAKVVPAERS